MGSFFRFLLHSTFNLLANLDSKTVTMYLIMSNYLHDHFCLQTIDYQLVIIKKKYIQLFLFLMKNLPVASLFIEKTL